jgi:hypothetical protein
MYFTFDLLSMKFLIIYKRKLKKKKKIMAFQIRVFKGCRRRRRKKEPIKEMENR